jgi:hypothetical protein
MKKIGYACGLQKSKGEGYVQKEGRCPGGSLHVNLTIIAVVYYFCPALQFKKVSCSLFAPN